VAHLELRIWSTLVQLRPVTDKKDLNDLLSKLIKNFEIRRHRLRLRQIAQL